MDYPHGRSTFVVKSQADLCSRQRVSGQSALGSVMVDSQMKELSTNLVMTRARLVLVIGHGTSQTLSLSSRLALLRILQGDGRSWRLFCWSLAIRPECSGSDNTNINWIVQDNVMIRTPSGNQDRRQTVFSKLPVLVVPTGVRRLFWKRHEQSDDV